MNPRAPLFAFVRDVGLLATFALMSSCATSSKPTAAPPGSPSSPSSQAAAATPGAQALEQEDAAAPPPPVTSSARLAKIVRDFGESAKRLDAFQAPYFNVEEDLGKFGDFASPEYFERAKALARDGLEKLKAVSLDELNPDQKRLYRLFKEDLEVALEGFQYPDELLAFNQMDNRLHSYLDDSSQELTTFPFDTVVHYEDFVRRSEGFPTYVDRQIQLLRRGMQESIMLSCDVTKRIPNSYKDGLETQIEKNPFWRPVLFMPKKFLQSDRTRLSGEFRKMISERILPGFRKFDAFFKKEYAVKCRKGYGLAGLPRAKEWYAYEIRAKTNLPLDAAAVHALGLSEVARIRTEIEQIKKELGFKGDFKSFLRSLTQNKRYFFKSPDEIFRRFEEMKAVVAQKIPSYFRLLPTSEYKIVASSNPEDAAGSYHEPTENVPFGRFVINTQNLRAVPIYSLTTLSLHEAVPGHHFQTSLQFEAKDRLSEYQRKIFSSTSFVEGWALYSEWLGNEMGLFADPLQRLGNRNDDMLRAVRLVVDSGIHAQGWSRAKAIAYMSANLANDAKDIANEANRYSVWPGQALAYKVGQQKIIQLRRMAEKELGAKFDVREFHRVVLQDGAVSLGVLETQVSEWVASTKGAPAAQAQPTAAGAE